MKTINNINDYNNLYYAIYDSIDKDSIFKMIKKAIKTHYRSNVRAFFNDIETLSTRLSNYLYSKFNGDINDKTIFENISTDLIEEFQLNLK